MNLWKIRGARMRFKLVADRRNVKAQSYLTAQPPVLHMS